MLVYSLLKTSMFLYLSISTIYIMIFIFLFILRKLCFLFIHFADITSLEIKGTTTQLVNKITLSETPLVIKGLPLIILFIIIALVGSLVILCGVFVGTYFYKHCIKQTTADHPSLKQQDGYDSLALDVQEQRSHSRPTYLEPVSETSSHYVDVNYLDN